MKFDTWLGPRALAIIRDEIRDYPSWSWLPDAVDSASDSWADPECRRSVPFVPGLTSVAPQPLESWAWTFQGRPSWAGTTAELLRWNREPVPSWWPGNLGFSATVGYVSWLIMDADEREKDRTFGKLPSRPPRLTYEAAQDEAARFLYNPEGS
jgi:hypothetical protein